MAKIFSFAINSHQKLQLNRPYQKRPPTQRHMAQAADGQRGGTSAHSLPFPGASRGGGTFSHGDSSSQEQADNEQVPSPPCPAALTHPVLPQKAAGVGRGHCNVPSQHRPQVAPMVRGCPGSCRSLFLIVPQVCTASHRRPPPPREPSCSHPPTSTPTNSCLLHPASAAFILGPKCMDFLLF